MSCAIASQIGARVTTYMLNAASAAPRPHTGPARPTFASFSGLPMCCFSITNAPTPGTNIGALAPMPSVRSIATWPISWM